MKKSSRQPLNCDTSCTVECIFNETVLMLRPHTNIDVKSPAVRMMMGTVPRVKFCEVLFLFFADHPVLLDETSDGRSSYGSASILNELGEIDDPKESKLGSYQPRCSALEKHVVAYMLDRLISTYFSC